MKKSTKVLLIITIILMFIGLSILITDKSITRDMSSDLEVATILTLDQRILIAEIIVGIISLMWLIYTIILIFKSKDKDVFIKLIFGIIALVIITVVVGFLLINRM